MPRAPVAEFPFYGERIAFPLHAQYMVLSTTHWMPLVNGYSDHIPQDFREAAVVLDSFPSNDSFAVLHATACATSACTGTCTGRAQDEIRERLEAVQPAPAASSRAMPTMTLYEIVAFP